MGEHVARPLIAVLLPEVRAGTAPPAASTLLATLLKRFPQHAALPAEGKEGVAAPPMHELAPAAGAEGAAAAAAAGVPAAGAEGSGLSGEMAALRLHQSASYTIESLLRWAGVIEESGCVHILWGARAALECWLQWCLQHQ